MWQILPTSIPFRSSGLEQLLTQLPKPIFGPYRCFSVSSMVRPGPEVSKRVPPGFHMLLGISPELIFNGFSMVSLWFLCGFFLVSLWLPYGFFVVSLWFLCGFPTETLRFLETLNINFLTTVATYLDGCEIHVAPL